MPGGIDVHARSVEREGLLIAGLEGCIRYRPKAPYMYTEAEMKRQMVRLFPHLMRSRMRHGRYLDLLVAHSPRFESTTKRIWHTLAFRCSARLCEPLSRGLLLHGHVHIKNNRRPRFTQYHDTLVINVYPYCQLDWNALPEPMDVVTEP